jgi:hypothetical protein
LRPRQWCAQIVLAGNASPAMPLEISGIQPGFFWRHFLCPKNPQTEFRTMNILDEYVSLPEAAKQCHKHPRTLYRWAQERDIGIIHLGKTPYVHVPTFRAALLRDARQSKD